MKSLYDFKLKFSIDEILNPSWQKPFKHDFFIKHYDSKDDWVNIIRPEFLKLLLAVQPVGRIMVFNKPASWVSEEAHIDPGKLYALNIVETDPTANSKMQWFTPKNENYEISYSVSNTPYINFKPEEITLVHEACLDNMVSVVNTSIAHRIKINKGVRTCVSIRSPKKFDSWENVYNFYKEIGWIA
jgi:hypothetical protein